jgi:hypothetical protein
MWLTFTRTSFNPSLSLFNNVSGTLSCHCRTMAPVPLVYMCSSGDEDNRATHVGGTWYMTWGSNPKPKSRWTNSL